MEEEAAAPALAGGSGAVRVIARICPPSAAAGTTTAAPAPAAGTSLFQVEALLGPPPAAGALLCFTPLSAFPCGGCGRAAAGQRKNKHRLDWCYLQKETNHDVFLHELKPILAPHLHHPTTTTAGSNNACVVACGAAAAQDHLFKGSQDQPGLLTFAMEEILKFAASIDGAVSVSSYQLVQDTHVFDLLEPKEQEVLVLKDAQGKTHLKGLSKVQVMSIEDFKQLGCFDVNQDKQQPTKASSTQQQQPTKPFSTQQQPAKASSTQLPTRGHQGLIIHISSSHQDGKERVVAKINFLSLTDYVDPCGVAALSSGNKSLRSLMNVVHALNSNQSFVTYRESKITRILQDSLCKTSGAVVIACLEEVSCQDAFSTLRLVACSSQVATQVANEQCRRSVSVKRADVNSFAVAKSSSRPILSCMHQPNPMVEKQDRPRWNMSALKASRTPIANKRSQPIMHSAKKTESTVSAPTKMKQKDAKPAISGRSQVIVRSAKKTESSLSPSIKMKQKDAKPTTTSGSTLLCPSTNSAKEAEVAIAPATVSEVEEVQSSQGMEIDAPSTDEAMETTQEEGMETTQEEVEQPADPKTPAIQLKLEQAADHPTCLLKTFSTRIKKSVDQEGLSLLKSGNMEQLQSLKHIGEKRASHIINLREESPELFKGIDDPRDLRDVIGLNMFQMNEMLSAIPTRELFAKKKKRG